MVLGGLITEGRLEARLVNGSHRQGDEGGKPQTRPFGICRRTTCSESLFLMFDQFPELWRLVPSGRRGRVESGTRAKARVGLSPRQVLRPGNELSQKPMGAGKRAQVPGQIRKMGGLFTEGCGGTARQW